jgi:hypothetical protein
MNDYNSGSLRSNLMAALFTIIFSATCIGAALAPAHNAGSSANHTIVA